MKLPFSFLACALCLVLALSSCGDATSSQSEDSGAAATADAGGTGKAKSQQSGPQPSKVIVGEYEQEGPFSAVSGGKGNEKPRFEPSGRPAPKAIVSRELEVGSGPAAQRGDEVGVYYAGALHETGQVQLYEWPPGPPATIQLGSGIWGASWEKTIEGMKVGGLRQVIIPKSEWAEGKPVDYVILLKALQPQSG
jgi:FKBP-type peptidyl-prolyl cis-trans isomerase